MRYPHPAPRGQWASCSGSLKLEDLLAWEGRASEDVGTGSLGEKVCSQERLPGGGADSIPTLLCPLPLLLINFIDYSGLSFTAIRAEY